MNNKRYRIYALLDPRDNRVRYVGLTGTPLHVRMFFHLQSARHGERGPKATWIRELLELRLEPQIVLIEETLEGPKREIYWIAHFRKVAGDLTNWTDGGELGTSKKKKPPAKKKVKPDNTKILKPRKKPRKIRW